MQKVIINKCFGGYGFEPFTIQKYAEAKGLPLFWYERDYEYDAGRLREKLDRTTISKIETMEGLRMGIYPMQKDMGDSFIFEWGNNEGIFFEMPEKEESRTDPVLIEIIEKYGDRNRHGCHAPTVVEVPDGVEWVVDEYDGLESLHEAHRIFG